jgi:hypothetical protein
MYVRCEVGNSYKYKQIMTAIYGNGRYTSVNISVSISPDVHGVPLDSSRMEAEIVKYRSETMYAHSYGQCVTLKT